MKTLTRIVATVFLLTSAGQAGAQSQACRYEGQEYPEGSSVCQAGLRQNCVNGEWQSLDGSRCDVGDEERMESPEDSRVRPQGGFAED